MNKWISTKDRLPDKNQDVFFTMYTPAYYNTEVEADFPESLVSVQGQVHVFKNKIYWCYWDEISELVMKMKGHPNPYVYEDCGGERVFITAWMPVEIPKPYRGRAE